MSSQLLETKNNPREGMLAIVRKRNAVISEVRAYSGATGLQHLVRLEYMDDHRPQIEEIIGSPAKSVGEFSSNHPLV